MRFFKVISFLSVFLFLAIACAFAEIQVTSTFSKTTAKVGEEIHLTIRVSGAMGNVQAPRLQNYKGIDTFYTGRVSNISFVNGQSSSTVEFSYIFVPRLEGKFNLDPIQVNVQGGVYQTRAITLEVVGGSAQTSVPQQTQQASPTTGYQAPRQQQQQAPSVPQSVPKSNTNVQPPQIREGVDDENIFAQAWIDKKEVYPNEQVLLSYSLYTRYDTRYDGFEEEPQISGFWIEEFPMQKDVQRETVTVKGKRYIRADIRKIALFPTTPADYTINPGTMKASIRQQPQQTSIFDDFFDDSFFSGGSFFARRENRTLKPAPIQLTVKPFPEAGKPQSFEGAVGNFKMTSSLNKKEVKQNEPLTMTIVIEGEGNIETLNKPALPKLKSFKVYEADTATNLFENVNFISGKKTFEVVFIPKEAGAQTIPAMEFSFFNPKSVSYQTLKTNPVEIQVEKSESTFTLPSELSKDEVFKKGVERQGRDIQYIFENLKGHDARLRLDRILKIVLGVDFLLLIFLILNFFRSRQEEQYAKNNALRRRKTAKTQAMARYKKLKKLDRSKKEGAATLFFEEARKLLTQYLSDKFDLSTLGGTRHEIEDKFEKTLGSQDPLCQEVSDFYDLCDASNFGGLNADHQHRQKALAVISDVIKKVEKAKL